MPGIALSIILDRADKTYRNGEPIKGQVKVEVGEEFQMAALLLVLYCRGFSQEKRAVTTIEKEKAAKNLFKGPWPPGAYSYPFEIVAPHGPFTYKGQVFELTWHLGAKVRSSTGEDVTALMDITVLPEERNPQDTGAGSPDEVVYTQAARSLKGFFVFSCALLLIGAIVSWRNSPLVEDQVTGVFIFGGIIPTLLGLAVLFLSTWQALVNRRIKEVEVRLSSRRASPGARISCSVTFQANMPFEVDKVSVVLRGEEILDFRSPSRDDGKLRKHLLHEHEQELALEVKQVSANMPVRAWGDIMVPAGVPYSINLMESDEGMALRWQLDFRIEMKKWPDWMHTETITVSP
jgi:hypothetical protein